MSLSLLPIHDQITVKLKELAQDIYENGVPDDSELTYAESGMLLPFIVVRYSGFIQRSSERGLTGPRQDLGRSYAELMCVGPTERSARQVFDLVSDKLTGFEPTGSSILMPEGIGKPYTVYDGNSKPLKYVADITFSFAVNTVVS
jgi:hypothetical protein